MYNFISPSMLLKLKYCLNTFSCLFVFVYMHSKWLYFFLDNIIDYKGSIIKYDINVQ